MVALAGVVGAGRRTAPGEGLDWCYKAVAPPRYRGDILGLGAFAQQPTQGHHVDLEIVFLDHPAWPHAREQFLLGYHLSGPCNERRQNIQRSASDPDRRLSLQKQLALGDQHERTERVGSRRAFALFTRHCLVLPFKQRYPIPAPYVRGSFMTSKIEAGPTRAANSRDLSSVRFRP